MVTTLPKQTGNYDMKPKKFIVWLFVVSSTIMFGGWTSYYLVFSGSKGKGHGLVLPDVFIYSTLVLVASSICLFLASRAQRKSTALQKRYLGLTFILGIVFAYMQFSAWSQMSLGGAYFINNNAGISMIYVFTFFHCLHIIAGLCLIASAFFGAGKVTAERNAYRMEIASIFWHFIDILWIYLYVFLLLNR
ncbi:cytochrome c oxidase subunit 3 [Pedobacter sp. SYP-B3415]|uniref:cytochrome c oxidase subunit 3 n=1 Tax=Pedobacter sp. SYP-B3415 TaxID=2496641 RepID=UPI00101CD876|nr:cytochrome c oxidase subunit 3 [Pedobacter sp. SYP-B3415]